VLHVVVLTVYVSQQKWGETLQASQASRAQESKRQLENFIDTTSHEMRNPLSAIVQCADSIISSHNTLERSMGHQDIYGSISDITVDAAETIVQCSKHMKNIVDDVLTMSKLDSGLFVMTPVDVQLESIARDAVKMFEGEAKSAGVDLHFRLEESYKKARTKNVSLDPTRVLQILINLLTNAIKFTRLEETRRISVSLGVSLEQPSQNGDGRVTFLRMSEATEAKSLLADWEKGEIVYVIFSVQDTGRGLSDAEHKLLFARFSQASPRTHIDYGGSGLGLFISRCLSEMHGGAIAFASTPGVGSTFSFYVKTRKSKPPRLERSGSNVAVDPSIRTEINPPNQRHRDQITPPIPSSMPLEKEIANSDLHILVVEDNLVNQRVLTKQLRNLGINVAVANHGGEALEHLRSTNYCIGDARATTDSLDATNAPANNLSLILMDWEMPVMDGLTCVRNIRQLQRDGIVHGHVPVIAVTANARSEQVTVALEAGMDDVISKPFRIPELCACIRKTLKNTKNI
jgi:signal transduction histidine kinase/CheY-like chemotaxis protein